MTSQDVKKVEYGCIFCKTGQEEQTAHDIELLYSEMKALNPVKLRYRRVNGKPVEERVSLFPGYIFVCLPADGEVYKLMRTGLIYKVLKDSDDEWRLSGADRALVEKMYRDGGVFGFSKAFYENDRIRIVEGPLKEYEGKILRVNHRKQTAQVQMSIQGMDMVVWLGFELIER